MPRGGGGGYGGFTERKLSNATNRNGNRVHVVWNINVEDQKRKVFIFQTLIYGIIVLIKSNRILIFYLGTYTFRILMDYSTCILVCHLHRNMDLVLLW